MAKKRATRDLDGDIDSGSFSAVNDTRRDRSPIQKQNTIDMHVSAQKKRINIISVPVKGANIGRDHRVKSFLISVGLSVTMLACADPVVAAQKPWPAGIFDLPGAITQDARIGPIDKHPWLNPAVDGLRIRVAWKDIEAADGVYDWSLIDECLANAATSGKVVGITVAAGIGCPAWLYGGDSFTDGTISGYTVESATAAFDAADIGRVLYSDDYPNGYAIIVAYTATVATVSVEASKTASDVRFSILARHPVLSPFRVLTGLDPGIMSVPWDTVFLTKWKRFIAAFGARYDGNPYLLYVPMGGLGQTGESRVAIETSDIAWFDANAVANGYSATADYSAAVVAWKASTEAIMDAYMLAFPTTPPFITMASCFGSVGGSFDAISDIVAYAAANYPDRLGFMNSQLNAVTGGQGSGIISENWATNPTGAQFLYSSASSCGVAGLSKCDGSALGCEDYDDNPCLSAFDAVNNTLAEGVSIGCRFVEVYEVDVLNPDYQTMLATQGAALRLNASPTATLINISTRSRVLTGDQVLIGGFIITGTDPKKVLIYGIGPSLNGVGVTLSDPTLELHQGSTIVTTNDNWKINEQTQQSQETDIEAVMTPPTNNLESAILATLTPGAYTAILGGKNKGTGVGLVEVYDLAQVASSKLASISTRGFVDGDNVMIGGFILGAGSARVIIRAIGPSLTSFEVAGALQDPTLELHDANGVLIQSNDNWRSDQEGEIKATTLPPSNDSESAIVSILSSGAYTAIVRGKNGALGVALVEVYQTN